MLSLSSEAGPAGTGTTVDDTGWATARHGTLYATDGSNEVFAIRGAFDPGTAFSAVVPASGPNWLGTLDLNTGVITRIPGVTIHPKGLLFLGDEGDAGNNGDDDHND